MNTAQNFFRHGHWLAVLATIFGLSPLVLQAESNSPPATLSAPAEINIESETEADREAARKLQEQLQLQAQLQAAKIALERNRMESEALSNAIAGRLQALETAVQQKQDAETEQLQTQLESVRKDLESNNRLLLIVGGGIAGVGFFVLLATAFLQWRSVNRLAEFSAVVQAARAALPAPGTAGTEANLIGAGAAAQSNARLFGSLTQLEQRILELEHTAHPNAVAPANANANGTNGSAAALNLENGESPAPHDSLLLAKGQSLLNLEKPAEALACFEEILQLEPNHGEALVKKGIALEQLERAEEALDCYDRAIAANADLTIAYLQKGGLFNRLERYEEALQCYEKALHAQEKAQHA
jgi:tetratricopeptide (TPR) repeat protein